MRLTPGLLLEFARYEHANARARADYRLRPNSACPRRDCDQLANGRLCIHHEQDNAASAVRRRKSAA